MTTYDTQNVFAYGRWQRVQEWLNAFPVVLSGFEIWMRGKTPSIKTNLSCSVQGWLYAIPVDLLDRFDVESKAFGEYHRFKVQVWDSVTFHDAWTYQLIEDADDYTRAASFTLNQDLYESAAVK